MSARRIVAAVAIAAAAFAAAAPAGSAQDIRIRDLVVNDLEIPVRLVGYGLVVGLDGTGDRAIGTYGSAHTVRSVVNLLRNFSIEVPPQVLRTRNVAAVLVTAEVSPYLRAGGRFDVQVSSIGDAVTLRGGTLWMTPLVHEVGGQVVGTAQGSLLMSDGGAARRTAAVETSARLPNGGLLVDNAPRPRFAEVSRILLREPNLGTAARIAEAINQGLGGGTARVEDPGSVALELPPDLDRVAALTEIGELRVQPDRRAHVIIDGRDGTVAAGGDLVIGEAVVSHGLLTLTVGSNGGGGLVPGDVRMEPGATVQEVAAALHAVGAPPATIAAVFESLRHLGALSAEVTIR